MHNEGKIWGRSLSGLYQPSYLIIVWALSSCLLAQATEDCEKFLNEGWQARQQRDFPAAEQAYRQAIAANPESSEAQTGLLYTYIEQQEFAKAERMVDAMLPLWPDNIWVRKGAAWTLFNRRRYREAADHYRYVLKENGEDCEMRLGLGLSLVRAGQTEDGRQECRKCQAELQGDPRLNACLQEQPASAEWRFIPQIYGTYIANSRQRDYYTASVTLDLELYHFSGFGIMAQLSYLYSRDYSTQITPSAAKDYGEYNEFAPGLALYYWKPDYLLWLYGSIISSDYEKNNLQNSSVDGMYCLYANYYGNTFYVGGGFASVIYRDFSVFQFAPEVGLHIGHGCYLKTILMFQGNDGQPGYHTTKEKNRISAAFELETKASWLHLNACLYVGDRWFTVEDRGLLVWNTDKEFDWGCKIKTIFSPGQPFSPYLAFRFDHVARESGEKQDFYLLGFSGGLLLNF